MVSLLLSLLFIILSSGLDTLIECKIQNGGIFKVLTHSEWSPLGAQRFIDLVIDEFYDGSALFRCQKDITVQFGIPRDREKMRKWHKIGSIEDDPKRNDLFQQSHWKSGLISFAGGGINSRGGQIFVTLNDNIPHLGGESWETPFAQVIEGLNIWKTHVYFDYGDRNGPDQGTLFKEDAYTNYLPNNFPKLSYMEYCKVIHDEEHYDEIGHILSLELSQIIFVTLFVIVFICCAVICGNYDKYNNNLKLITGIYNNKSS